MKKHIIVTAVLVALAGLFAGLLFLSRSLPEFTTNVYTKHIFKYVSLPVKLLFHIFPFSAGEIILIVLAAGIPIALIVSIILCITRRSGKPIARFGLNILSIASVAVILFVLFGGFNYSALTCGTQRIRAERVVGI